MSTRWEVDDAALAKAAKDNPCPPCPACGAPGAFTFVNVTAFNDQEPQFLPTEARCTAQCWRTDPERYLGAIK